MWGEEDDHFEPWRRHIELTLSEYDHFSSAIGNALHSGLNLEEVWSCISMASDGATTDAAIAALIRLKELSHGNI